MVGVEDDEQAVGHLCRITQEVFLLMTEIELQPCAAVEEGPSWVSARLCYRTLPGLELELSCGPSLAFAATQRLMSFDRPPATVDDAVRDSVAELLNMVGGNFHSVLSPGDALDTTPVSSETEQSGRRLRIAACLGGEEGHVRLRLTERAQ
jgi:hypothetical protein